MNTKFVFVTLLACLATSFALSQGVGERIECFHQSKLAQSRILEGKIKEAFEQLRELIKKGVPGVGPLDPLDVKDGKLNINNKYVNANATLTAKSTGLAGFKLTKVSLSVIGLKLKLTLTWPKLSADGDYSLDLSSPSIEQKVYGQGAFKVNFDDLATKLEAKITTKTVSGKTIVQIKSVKVDPSLKKFSLDVTGIMNDEKLSSEISSKLSKELPGLIKNNKDKLNELIGEYLPYLNDILAGNGGKNYGVDTIIC